MDKNALLKKAYNLFINEYSDFSYQFNDILLWTVTEDEYPLAYQNAAKLLNLKVKPTIDQLKQYAVQLRAELLKTSNKIIIVLKASLLEASDESLKIVLHELAHAYYDNTFKNKPPNDEVLQFLFQIGTRMWKEYTAEYFTSKILHLEEKWSYSSIEREFKSLLHNISLYPERLGFFFIKCKITATSSIQIAEAVGIKNEAVDTKKLFAVMDKLQNILEKELNQSTALDASNEFLVQLGMEIVTFVCYYFRCYNHTETFLNQTEGQDDTDIHNAKIDDASIFFE